MESLKLHYVLISSPKTDVLLLIEHCGAEYVGALLLDDPAFCREIFEVLSQHLGNTIQEIGDIDLEYTL